MASYFDLPPQQKAPAASIEQVPVEQRKQLGRMSLMSPAVTQILEGLGDEHSDSNSSEGEASSEDLRSIEYTSEHTNTHKTGQNSKKHMNDKVNQSSLPSLNKSFSNTSTKKGSSHGQQSSARTSGVSSAKQKQPGMARFHSLRSMLFQANIEDKMKTITQEDRKDDNAATKWKSQHEERQMHHPNISEKDVNSKNGIGSRIRLTMRRMTTKDAGGMEKIREDGAPVEFNDRLSTASSDNEEDEKPHSLRKSRDSDSESINHSDVEELVRWVSRRDAPSDGEGRKGELVETKADSGHESLGNSDVDDLVRYASRRSVPQVGPDTRDEHTGYSDASTESDSELEQVSSEEEENADELVRWISRREGPGAGPVRRNLQRPELDSDVEQHYDSDVPELGRWFKRHDGTSGESAATTPVHQSFDEAEELERGRPRSRDSLSMQDKRHMTHEDVDELVRWISRKDSKQQDAPIPESDDLATLNQNDEEKKQEIGMSVDQGSLSHADVEELIAHARKTSGGDPVQPTPALGAAA
jgi:hypothetical protein